jgi:hypothetical protein
VRRNNKIPITEKAALTAAADRSRRETFFLFLIEREFDFY